MQGNFISFPRSVSAPLLFPLIRSAEEEAGTRYYCQSARGRCETATPIFAHTTKKKKKTGLRVFLRLLPRYLLILLFLVLISLDGMLLRRHNQNADP